MEPTGPPLPIDERIGEIVATVDRGRALVVVAPPGAGKTTRVPPALVGGGPVIVLQPRRIAARSIARRIAAEQGWTAGGEVGWQVRYERNFTSKTRLLVATEGILTARLQADPLLSGFRTIVLDEFHERSVHADLALALARQAMLARDDLRIVVMSATLDAGPVAEFLGGCPIIRVDARTFPVEVAYEPVLSLRAAVERSLEREGGHVLVFLPGAPEIGRAMGDLRGIAAAIHPLHGSLTAEEQDAAIATRAGERRVILATNIAETSLTVEGVTEVIDTGLQKSMRYDPAVGIDRLELGRISLDSADQRAGRAGRTAPGRATRLWDPRQQLEPHREPEIRRVDLAAPLLEIFAWGGDPATFEWFERPPADSIARAVSLLEDLGGVRSGKITAEGEAMQRLPLHPRHARVMLSAGGSGGAAAACAILSEGIRWAESRGEADILDLVAKIGEAPFPVRKAASEISRAAQGGRGARDDEETLRRALFDGYADRLARRREPGTDRFLLASGYGAVLAREAHVPPEAELVAALDLQAPRRGGAEGILRLASVVDREWITPTGRERIERFDPATRSVRALEVERFHAIPLREHVVAANPDTAAKVLAEIVASLLEKAAAGDALSAEESGLYPPAVLENAAALIRRLRFAGVEVRLESLALALSEGKRSLPELRLLDVLPWEQRQTMDRLAPSELAVPSGRQARLDYRADGTVVLAIKLQELFGLAESPRIGPRKTPVTIELRSPGGRPVQTTNDLRSFWDGAYQEVRKELRGRYPKHPWPEDPWTAPATARAKRRR